MRNDVFVGVKEILNMNSVLVRIINCVGVPYSVIMERGPDGRFIEMCNTPTNGDGGAMTEREMVTSCIERILK